MVGDNMETYRMTIVFNDGSKPYHNRHTVFVYDGEALKWIKNYASRYTHYWWYDFVEYLLVNTKTGVSYRGRVNKDGKVLEM